MTITALVLVLVVYMASECVNNRHDGPRSPDEVRKRCSDCDEWKSLENFPFDLDCPTCGKQLTSDPREETRACAYDGDGAADPESDRVEHELFCCRCGTWLYNAGPYGRRRTQGYEWKCPKDNCATVSIKKSF